MKEKCDNRCETCPAQTQIHCALGFSKATNASIGAIVERMERIEEAIQDKRLINPLETNTAILPALEQEETTNIKQL